MKNKMMIRRILIGLFLGIVVTSCTHNDGYIGPLFGKWQLIEMWENGTMTHMIVFTIIFRVVS